MSAVSEHAWSTGHICPEQLSTTTDLFVSRSILHLQLTLLTETLGLCLLNMTTLFSCIIIIFLHISDIPALPHTLPSSIYLLSFLVVLILTEDGDCIVTKTFE